MTNPVPARLLALGGASLALLASPLSAQTPPPPSAVDLAQRGDDLAWSITEDLTTEIGQRMAGTEGETVARRWEVAGRHSDRRSHVEGQSGAVRVDLGGGRIIEKHNTR